jgi:hypothetical protein
LLRWYPRAWRERYGAEFLATVEDSLDGAPPTLRLRLSVAGAGLRERGRRARRVSGRSLPRLIGYGGKPSGVYAGLVVAMLPWVYRTAAATSPWTVSAARDTLIAAIAVIVLAAAGGALAALPALARFLRAGGRPRLRRKLRRQVVWASAATVPTAAGLAWLATASDAAGFDLMNFSQMYFAVLVATMAVAAIALALWASAVVTVGQRLDLRPRIQTAERMLGAAAKPAVTAIMAIDVALVAAVNHSVLTPGLWLLLFALQIPLRKAVTRRTERRRRAS